MTSVSRRWSGACFIALAVTILATLPGRPSLLRNAVADVTSKPAKKDSNLRIRPKEATLTPGVEPGQARPGSLVTYQVVTKLEPGWHIYKYDKTPDADGPRNTTFELFDTDGLELASDWTPSRPPTRKAEPAFNNKILEFYEDDVTWSVKLRVPAGAAPGAHTIRCQAGYQICNASSCKIPGQWTLPDVTLTVAGAAAAAPAEQPSSPKVAETPAAAPAEQPSSPKVAETPAAAPAEKSAAAAAVVAPPAGADPSAKPTAAVSEVAQRAERGLIPFLLFSAGGGLLALVMPCVWPMVPITVNFFVKQGQHNKNKTTGLAVAYCLAIIGIFTSLGVFVSFFFSATALQNLANNPWLNTFVAVMFLLFGLSLLGLFEVRLPNFLLNASARGEGRGGIAGVMFMALTLTITSFTCTFPVVGGLIVMAAGGQFFYPIIGLATFSAVLAFPFFLLALAPGLLTKVPKSGDWMNAVKVVGGLVEIGAALKFINTAEIGFGAVPEDAWIDAPVVLSAWVMLAVVSGVYLLGLFRTDHDHAEVKIGPGRLLLGSFFLAFALFLAPALFGHPPKSPVWNALVGILPADVGELESPAAAAGPGAAATTEATSSDPEVALRQKTSFHGVTWGFSYDQAIERAKAERKPVLIDFTGVNCANCRAMEVGVMPRKEIASLLSNFVTVQLYTDYVPIASLTKDQRLELAQKNQLLLLDLSAEPSNPYYAVLGADGKVLRTIGGKTSPAEFASFLDTALGQFQTSTKVATAEPRRE